MAMIGRAKRAQEPQKQKLVTEDLNSNDATKQPWRRRMGLGGDHHGWRGPW